MSGVVWVIGTMDTKGSEVAFVADTLKQQGLQTLTVDVSAQGAPTVLPDISSAEVLKEAQGPELDTLRQMDRGQAIACMGQALERFVRLRFEQGQLIGAIGLGGSGGTALISQALRGLPIGIPKLIVSTVASGNIAPYVGGSDLVMFPSIVDVAGLNTVSIRILSNAAHAMAGMVSGPAPSVVSKPAVGMTMFGVTTPCVTRVRECLEGAGWDCLVFHATGTGGQAMESLVESRFLSGLLDLTTTEVADEVVGGVFRAGSKRFDVLASHPVPCVLSFGAMDMVNFGAMETVPEPFRQRKLHIHNANVTLMRTTAEENRQCAAWMAGKLLQAKGPLVVLIPVRGVSALDAPGKPFYDPEADEALFSEFERRMETRPEVRIVRADAHINDPEFAQLAVDAFLDLTRR